eukprot:gnl/TRDRNA2_/TRDRNA2_203002_c0_seq1.p1 gnl/TRDRNA2_/TRDRNA2_203002_c0~~gnl/TRDRNA2_/TRDRNA2_203002_c0_seq1.p1  ORF type:complete len:168 (+),score=31.88 gnl/TRDRNA2_/TRDRNA2_203002_c0_seq1:66-569(+)
MASNVAYANLDGPAPPRKNSVIGCCIICLVAACVLLFRVSSTPGFGAFVDLSVGASSFSNSIQAVRVKSPFAKVVVQGGAYQPPNSKPYAENYLGKLRDAPMASISAALGGGYSEEQIAFMKRKQALRSGSPPASAKPSAQSEASSAERGQVAAAGFAARYGRSYQR